MADNILTDKEVDDIIKSGASAGNVSLIKSKKTDAELADTYRRGAEEILMSLLGLINEARQHGLIVQFQFGEDGFGRQALAALNILKKL